MLTGTRVHRSKHSIISKTHASKILCWARLMQGLIILTIKNPIIPFPYFIGLSYGSCLTILKKKLKFHPYKFSRIQSLHHVSVSQEGHVSTGCRSANYFLSCFWSFCTYRVLKLPTRNIT
jgi:hypothetical protein